MIKDKNAQIGETVTWMVATIIIVAVLIISLFVAFGLAKTKKKLPFIEKRKSDILMEKSLFTYFSADDAKKAEIYSGLEQQELFANLNKKKNEIQGVLE